MILPYQNLLLTILATAFVLGLVLAYLGLRGRRVGSEPRCRRCGYDLTGGPVRCPECGRPASGRNVVTGVRRRRWLVAAMGLALLLISMTGVGSAVYGRARSVNWYPYLPTFVLVLQAESDETKAIWELAARVKSGKLTAAKTLSLVPQAMESQKTEWDMGKPTPWIDFLAACDGAGALPRVDREQFREALVPVASEFPYGPDLFQGKDGRYCYVAICRGRPGVVGSYSLDGYLRVGDWVGAFPDSPQRPLNGSGGSMECVAIPIDELQPGAHWATLELTLAFHNPSFTREIKREFEVTIRPEGDIPIASDAGPASSGP